MGFSSTEIVLLDRAFESYQSDLFDRMRFFVKLDNLRLSSANLTCEKICRRWITGRAETYI